MPKHRFVETPSGAKYVEIVETKGVRNSSAAESAMQHFCFKCREQIGKRAGSRSASVPSMSSTAGRSTKPVRGRSDRMGTPRHYYNEFDPFAAAWLRELINDGLIPDGDIDTRSIVEVQPDDLIGYTQCHFFAGIGGWPLALQLAGWPADRPVFSGSCPCQPFSSAGKQQGESDARHLWPEFRRLIEVRRPICVLGEQVASRAGRTWLAAVRADLEGLGYAVGAADLCSASVGAPHIRQRLYFVADANDLGRRPGHGEASEARGKMGVWAGAVPRDSGALGLLADTADTDRWGGIGGTQEGIGPIEQRGLGSSGDRAVGGMGDTCGQGLPEQQCERGAPPESREPCSGQAPVGAGAPSAWADVVWLPCRDGKTRPVPAESVLQCMVDGVSDGVVPSGDPRHGFPLAQGVQNRVGLLRGVGNAITPELAATFIRAYLRSC